VWLKGYGRLVSPKGTGFNSVGTHTHLTVWPPSIRDQWNEFRLWDESPVVRISDSSCSSVEGLSGIVQPRVKFFLKYIQANLTKTNSPLPRYNRRRVHADLAAQCWRSRRCPCTTSTTSGTSARYRMMRKWTTTTDPSMNCTLPPGPRSTCCRHTSVSTGDPSMCNRVPCDLRCDATIRWTVDWHQHIRQLERQTHAALIYRSVDARTDFTRIFNGRAKIDFLRIYRP